MYQQSYRNLFSLAAPQPPPFPYLFNDIAVRSLARIAWLEEPDEDIYSSHMELLSRKMFTFRSLKRQTSCLDLMYTLHISPFDLSFCVNRYR